MHSREEVVKGNYKDYQSATKKGKNKILARLVPVCGMNRDYLAHKLSTYKDMKVTAILADDLVNNVREYTHGSTVTEAITIALKDWVDIYHIKELNQKISTEPIIINSENKIRKINRKA